MRKVFVVFAGLMLAAVLAQFYLATFGAFETPPPAKGGEGAGGAIDIHSLNGVMVIPIISLLTTIVAALARAGGKLIGLSALPIGLVVVQLFVIFELASLAGWTPEKSTTASHIVLGFHAIDGLAILWVAIVVFRRARALAKTGSATAEKPQTVAAGT